MTDELMQEIEEAMLHKSDVKSKIAHLQEVEKKVNGEIVRLMEEAGIDFHSVNDNVGYSVQYPIKTNVNEKVLLKDLASFLSDDDLDAVMPRKLNRKALENLVEGGTIPMEILKDEDIFSEEPMKPRVMPQKKK